MTSGFDFAERFFCRRGGGDCVDLSRSEDNDSVSHRLISFGVFQPLGSRAPFRLVLRLDGCGDVVDFDSSKGREDGLYKESTRQFPTTSILIAATHPGCDMTGRPRTARRGAAGAVPGDAAVWDAEVRCLLDLWGGDGTAG